MGDQLKIAATWEAMNRAYAGSLGVFLVFVNRVGPRTVDGKNLQYWGGSEVIAPSGEQVAKAPYNNADLLLVEVDLARARQQQTDAHIFRDFDAQLMRDEFDRAVTAMAARRKT
jgi:predicted amidohydrolase